MKIFLTILTALFFFGCGGGGDSTTKMKIGEVYKLKPGNTIIPNEENSIVIMQRSEDGNTTAQLTQGSATLSH
jgi:hypothetical protein